MITMVYNNEIVSHKTAFNKNMFCYEWQALFFDLFLFIYIFYVILNFFIIYTHLNFKGYIILYFLYNYTALFYPTSFRVYFSVLQWYKNCTAFPRQKIYKINLIFITHFNCFVFIDRLLIKIFLHTIKRAYYIV